MADTLDAVLDAPSDQSSVDTSSVDTSIAPNPTDQPTPVDAPTSDQAGDGTSQDGPSPDDSPEIFANGRLTPGAYKAIGAIEKTHPKIARQLKVDAILASNFRQTVPGGLREVANLQKVVKDAGGPQGIAEQQRQLGVLSELDQSFTRDGVKFIEALTDPEVQPGQTKSPLDSFKAIAPKLMDTWLSVDPDARAVLVSQNLVDFSQTHPAEHSAYLCQCIKGDMMEPLQELGGQSFVGIINLMNHLPPDSAEHGELRKSLTAYANRIFKMASQPFEVKAKAQAAPQNTGMDPRVQELDAREQKIRETEMKSKMGGWVNASRSEKQALYKSEFDRLAKGLSLSDQKRSAIELIADQNINKAVKRVPNLLNDLKAHFESDDREGYLRAMSKIYRDVVPGAIKSAFDIVVDRPKAATTKPAAVPSRTAQPSSTPQHPQPRQQSTADSWEQITGTPDPKDVDMLKTSKQMVTRGEFVLKNGRRVKRV